MKIFSCITVIFVVSLSMQTHLTYAEETMQQVYEKAREYILQNGSELQKTMLAYVMGDTDKDAVIQALQPYQNDDGGWANGLEIEYQGDVSTPMTTAAALGYLAMFNLGDTVLLEKTLQYLGETQAPEGSWDDIEAILQFPLPDYMGPGKYVEYKTGMILKWLKRLPAADAVMPEKAYHYLLARFPEISKTNDFWAAAAYANAFSEYPPTEEHQRVLQWAQQALMPPQDPLAQSQDEPQTLPWMMIQGMLHDDSYRLVPMKDQVLAAIKAHQLPNGGWSHPFGEYNAVWAAVLVVRYLNIHHQL